MKVTIELFDGRKVEYTDATRVTDDGESYQIRSDLNILAAVRKNDVKSLVTHKD
jgi:hypothetical protein